MCMWKRDEPQVLDVPSWHRTVLRVRVPSLLQNRYNDHLHDPVVLLNKEILHFTNFQGKSKLRFIMTAPGFPITS